MDIAALQSHVKASDLPFEKLAGNKSVSESDKVQEACRQFEAVLMRQILQEARKTVISSGESESSSKGIYDDMINNQMADSMTRSGGIGLAKSLQAQMVHQTLKTPLKGAHQTQNTTSAQSSQPRN